ncbi:thiamine phosphate synthase [Listeria grandensis]|uniref:thiamine phosphate synthase n=1 Tax=Listeria grandensis TaxID=1494963 RepID=UPI00164DD62D|nr:thiamine phosphate synthase [Listeria grandensis]MBC6316434.1 thiamine phosphate synthase [Listeria grandensis]
MNMLEVYFIAGTQDVPHGELLPILEDALQSGITCYQFREKKLSNPVEIEKLARSCHQMCREYHVPFFINDDVDLALEIQADGIHVGQEDMAISDVIAKCAGKMQIGLSINTFQQAVEATAYEQLAYIGVGPIFETSSKVDAKETTGLDLLSAIRAAGIDLPIVAIGGITTERVPAIRKAGAQGVAIISALVKSSDRSRTICAMRGI